MKTNLKVLAVMALMLAATLPAFAESVGTTEKPLSIIQFSQLLENRSVHGRLLERKYEAYRHGRVPRPTLSASEMR